MRRIPLFNKRKSSYLAFLKSFFRACLNRLSFQKMLGSLQSLCFSKPVHDDNQHLNDKGALISSRGLRKTFRQGKLHLPAVDFFDVDIFPGETLGLVGESGCGKSTAALSLARLCRPSSGQVFFEGVDIYSLSHQKMKRMRRKIQMIFQDPYASLNPRMLVEDIIGEALDIHGLARGKKQRKEKVAYLLELVGLHADHMTRFPHEFSGGQRQRIGIARALAVEPRFIICDEAISALDVSVQAQVVNLLKDLQKKMLLTYLFIAHDIAMVQYISDRIAVMYRGRLVELAASDALCKEPLHPYTQLLLSSVSLRDPRLERKREKCTVVEEDNPFLERREACVFCHRCPKAFELCYRKQPNWIEARKGRFIACHLIKNAPGNTT